MNINNYCRIIRPILRKGVSLARLITYVDLKKNWYKFMKSKDHCDGVSLMGQPINIEGGEFYLLFSFFNEKGFGKIRCY